MCYHRRYESSNNTEIFWSFDNDTLTTSEENEKYKQNIQEGKYLFSLIMRRFITEKYLESSFCMIGF